MGKNQSMPRKFIQKRENMNEIDLLEKIKSKYVIDNIFTYISKETFKLELFVYSKKYQEKLNLLLGDYQYNYIINQDIFLYKYFLIFSFDYSKIKKSFIKDLYNTIEPECISKFIQNFPENSKYQEQYGYKLKRIDIYSPLFEAFSKTGLLEKFRIDIDIDNIKKLKLNKQCKLIFDNLNNSNIIYNSIQISTEHYKYIDYIKQFNINFSLIKKLDIYSYSSSKNNADYFIKGIFKFNDIKNHLIELTISLYEFTHVKADSMSGINNLEVLEILSLAYISIDDGVFSLKLKNLKELYLSHCFLINFDDCSSNLIKLKFYSSYISKPKNPINMPNLEYFEIEDDRNWDKHNFDFSSFNKLKEFHDNGDNVEFLNSPLEIIGLSLERKEKEKKLQIFKKVFNIKTLKKIDIYGFDLSGNIISKIEGKNPSVKELILSTKFKNNYKNLKNIFPNLFRLYISYSEEFTSSPIEIKMKENSECKIDISLENSLKINFEPIEDLEKIKVLWKTKIELDSLPFFQEYYNGIFKSLIIFRLYIGIVSINNIIYLFKNIDNMPNLKEFEFNCYCNEIKVEDYNKCIIKLLSKNLDFIELDTNSIKYESSKYSIKELKNIYPQFKLNKYKQINIYKLKINKNNNN